MAGFPLPLVVRAPYPPVGIRLSNRTTSAAILSVIAIFCSTVQAAVHYVNVASTNPVPPFEDWSTAAVRIQDAIDSADAGDQVLVTNGLYNQGGYPVNGVLSNRVAVIKPLTVHSVNGPSLTFIQGVQPTVLTPPNGMRCAYLTNGVVLAGFTLTNGGTVRAGVDPDLSGAGAWCESTTCVLSNCVITGAAGFGTGGGAYRGTLVSCVLTNNVGLVGGGAYQSILSGCLIVSNGAPSGGGGVYQSALDNCVIIGNSADSQHGSGRGGGAVRSTLNNCTIVANGVYNFVGTPGGTGGGTSGCTNNNCIIYYNTAGSAPNDDGTSIMNYCCTIPLFGSGVGNISAQPRLVNPTQLDVHLQPNSPCINAGRNTYAYNTTDFDGNPRITGRTVDIGAYEFPNPTSIISYAWLQQYGLPTDGSADQADTDRDGMNNWQEWICGTNPTNAASLLQLLPLSADPSQVTVTWQSVTNRTYFLQRSADLSVQFSFQTIAIKIPGQLGTTTFIDTNATPPGPFFYRIGVGQ